MMIQHLHIYKVIAVYLVTPLITHSDTFFFLVMITVKIYSLSHFQVDSPSSSSWTVLPEMWILSLYLS